MVPKESLRKTADVDAEGTAHQEGMRPAEWAALTHEFSDAGGLLRRFPAPAPEEPEESKKAQIPEAAVDETQEPKQPQQAEMPSLHGSSSAVPDRLTAAAAESRTRSRSDEL